MPFREHYAIVLLVIVGLALCAGNVFVAYWRTAVPRQLNGVVTAMRVLPEKSPGVDDVLLVEFDKRPALQVEREIYNQLEVGSRVEKDAWSRSMSVDGESAMIDWSVDVQGMVLLMPIMAGTIIILALKSARTKSSSNSE